jgi:hypothetical protein
MFSSVTKHSKKTSVVQEGLTRADFVANGLSGELRDVVIRKSALLAHVI